MTYNDLGRWANMRLEFIKQHRPQLYQSLLKENRLHSYLAEFDRQVRDTLILTEEQKWQDQLEWRLYEQDLHLRKRMKLGFLGKQSEDLTDFA